MNKVKWVMCVASLALITTQATASELDFTDIKFDQLMDIEITSVSKKAEKLSEAAAAIYVVTNDEIRRIGATNIPEALRVVPGLDVAQIDPNKWAVSIRGFNGQFANKLLVMVDGRSVYTQTSSGVYWEALNYLMADINRIEVIRGPGATLWGANAVNGVINIITNEASGNDTGSLSIAAGNKYKEATLRHDTNISENTQLRAYITHKDQDESNDLSGQDQDNGGKYLQTGFRVDMDNDASQWLTFQGDIYKNDLQQQFSLSSFSSPYNSQILNGDVEVKGGNINARLGMKTSLDSELNMRISYDYYEHNDIQFNESRDTLNIDIEHQFSPIVNHNIVWGTGYRNSKSEIESTNFFSTTEPSNDTYLWNVFIQDIIDLPAQNMSLTLGVKVEDSNYSDTEIQPNIRLSWLPTEDITLWGAISRAIRTPSQVESDATINISVIPSFPQATLLQIVGNDDFESEKLNAYELGFRWIATPTLSFDIATFYNNYKNLLSYDLSFGPPTILDGEIFNVLPLNLSNDLQGNSFGSELLMTWQVIPEARLRFSYSFLEVDIKDINGSSFNESLISLVVDRSPKHQASLWGGFDLHESVKLDARLYYTAERSSKTTTIRHEIPSSFDFDLRLGWQASKALTLALVGKNMFHSDKQEFITESPESNSRIERSIFLNATYNW